MLAHYSRLLPSIGIWTGLIVFGITVFIPLRTVAVDPFVKDNVPAQLPAGPPSLRSRLKTMHSDWKAGSYKSVKLAIDDIGNSTSGGVKEEPIETQEEFLYFGALYYQQLADKHVIDPKTASKTAYNRWKDYLTWIQGLSITDVEKAGHGRPDAFVLAAINLGNTALSAPEESRLEAVETYVHLPGKFIDFRVLERWRKLLKYPRENETETDGLLVESLQRPRWKESWLSYIERRKEFAGAIADDSKNLERLVNPQKP